MSAIDRTAYPRCGAQLTREELGTRYDLTETDMAFVQAGTRTGAGRLLLATLLKARRDLGCSPAPNAIHAGTVAHLAAQLGVVHFTAWPDEVRLTKPLYRYQAVMRTYLSVTAYDALLRLLGPPPVLVAMEATGHYWENLYAVLMAAGHDVALLNPFKTRRFQDSALERTKTDAIDAAGMARFAFEKRPEATQLHDAAAEAMRELVRHRDRIRQDFDDRIRQLHRLVDLGFPEVTRYIGGLDSMLATTLLSECPTAHDFARATPKRLAKLRYDGRNLVGTERATQLIEAAKHSIGQHHGPAYRLQAHHICQALDTWRRRLTEIECDIDGLLDSNEVGQLLLSIDGIGPQTAARIIAAMGDPARFKSAAAFAAYVGVVPDLKQSGKNGGRRAAYAPMGNARLRRAMWMPVVGAVRGNAWLKPFYDGLIARGKPPKSPLSPPCASCSTRPTASPRTASRSRSNLPRREENTCWR